MLNKIKLASLAFTLLCVFLAVYTVFQQVVKFQMNEDVSTISYRRFNEIPQDLYPTISFCFSRVQVLLSGCNNGIYDQEFLKKKFGINNCKFEQILRGKSYGKEFDMSRILSVNIDDLSMQPKAILSKFWTIDHRNIKARFWDNERDNISKEKLPIYISHRTPQKICLSRKTNFDPGLLRSNDVFTFNLTQLNLHGKLHLEVFAHYPNQTIRALGAFRNKKVDIYTYNLQYETWILYLSQFTVLRRRKTSHRPCGQHTDDDNVLRELAVQNSKCIPLYYEALIKSDVNMHYCRTYSDYNHVHQIMSNATKSTALIDEPCNRMTMQVHLEKEKKVEEIWSENFGYDILRVRIKYDDDMYQEITNKQEFELKNLWSNIGGLVGIFLGFSLSHIPQLLFNFRTWLQNTSSFKKLCQS